MAMVDAEVGPGATPTRAEHAARLADHVARGEARARGMTNRGPVRLGPDGHLHPDILAAYGEHGFYVFEGVVDPAEIDELRADVAEMIDRAPVRVGADVDAHGRPILGLDWAIRPYLMIEPLSDPWGGTDLLAGRHPTKMAEARPDAGAPEAVPYLMFGMCQAMASGLRLYGHPHLLAIAASINGDDFVPYNDAIFVKQAGLGGPVAWHQDGATHWDSPDWDMGIHGFNFQVQLHRTTAANALWVVPGTHRVGRVDIPALVAANGGSDLLPDAVPLLCEPGDVTVVNRQALHGSFANTSPDPRVSLTFGFHRRSSVLGVRGRLTMKGNGGPVYDEQRIFERSAVIAVAIDARHRHRPDEVPYTYLPFAGLEDDFRAGGTNADRVLRDYFTRDLAI